MKNNRENRIGWGKVCRWAGIWIRLSLFTLFILTEPLVVEAAGQSVTLRLENVSLKEAFKEIKRQLGYRLAYNEQVINAIGNVSVDVVSGNINEVMEQCLRGSDFSYEIENQIIVIYKKQAGADMAAPQKLIKLEGVVVDSKGGVLPGVTVVVKGTTIGVATDIDGKFSLEITETPGISLEFSFVGMNSKEIPVKIENGKVQPLRVVLEEAETELDEVVVTGMFSRKKEGFTGSAVTVKGDELKKISTTSIAKALSTIEPSFRIMENISAGSDPNRLPDMRMRGSSTLPAGGAGDNSLVSLQGEYDTYPNQPLLILDGFEIDVQTMVDLDPDRVQSITMLKDASATAIYGSKASNGVIVIETYTPKPGEINVSYGGNLRLQMPDLSAYNLMDAEEKIQVEALAGLYSPNDLDSQRDYQNRLREVKRGVDTYWLSQPLRTAVQHRHALTLEGGSEALRYKLYLGLNQTPGVMKESGRRRLALGMELQYIYKNLTFRNTLTYSNVKAVNSPYGSFSTYTQRNPYVRYKDDDGNYIYEVDRYIPISGGGLGQTFYNPLYNTTLNTIDEEKYNDVTNNFGVDWTIIEGLRLKGSFSFTHQNTYGDNFKPARHTDFADYSDEDFDRRGAYIGSRGENFSYDASAVLTYFWQLDKHVVNANLGWNLQENVTREFTVKTEGFPNENLDYISFATQYEKEGAPAGDEYTSRLVGFLGNLNYSYDERYLLDLSFREDASSRFGADKRWAPFWSAGLGWNLHNEGFLKDVTFINRLKIRGSYGLTGSQNYNPYQAMTTYKYLTGERYHHIVGAEVMALGNEKLGWQRTLQQNYGLDIDLWNERINITGNYYIKLSKDVLTSVTLPPSLGFDSYMDNLGEVKNYGYELSLRVAILKNPAKRLFWSVNANALHNKNKLMKISNALRAYNDSQDEDSMAGSKKKESNRPKVRYIEGESMNSIWVNRSLGIDPATGNEIYIKKDGSLTYEYDVNDKVEVGDENPKFQGNVQTNFYWKGFNLYLLFNYEYGAKIYNSTLATKVEGADPLYNADKRVLYDRWKKPGDVAMFRRIDDTSELYQTTRLVQDNNFINLSSLSLSYDVPRDILARTFIERCKFTFSMTDVFRISSIKQERGTSYPFARSFSFALNVTF